MSTEIEKLRTAIARSKLPTRLKRTLTQLAFWADAPEPPPPPLFIDPRCEFCAGEGLLQLAVEGFNWSAPCPVCEARTKDRLSTKPPAEGDRKP
jgi:hypothetical protein